MLRASPAVLYARIQNRDERRQGRQSSSQAPHHVQTQTHEFPDCIPTRTTVSIFSGPPNLTRNELCQLRRPHPYMLEFENGASSTRTLHARIQQRDGRRRCHQCPSRAPNHVQTQPCELSDCTPTPIDVSIISDTPSLTCNALCQLRQNT